MAANKPSVPKGTRDFSPAEMAKRNYIFDTIKTVFRKYGYQEIQTPSMENLETLTGKYGDEGDKLIFKILNNGDLINQTLLKSFDELLSLLNSKGLEVDILNIENEEVGNGNKDRKVSWRDITSKSFEQIFEKLRYDSDDLFELYQLTSLKLGNTVSEKALRYDLTVPFARYVVSHQSEITFPFKRFQVQPVWRADRPQKGRYREFYQCDADVVGSDSLLNEAEFILIYDEALSNFGLKDFTIKINNRKILSGIAEIIGKPELIVDMTVAIDKLDKIGMAGVSKELLERGFTEDDLQKLTPVILLGGGNDEKIDALKKVLAASPIGLKGIEEINTVFTYLKNARLKTAKLELDITLARGLNYYTGAIFEVKTNEVAMGSIGGGGRYDDLTGMFGLKGMTGAGISFGADRIYDVLEELKLFPEDATQGTQVLICCFDKEFENYGFQLVNQLRQQEIRAELYPPGAKIKKQLDYANNKNIPFTIMIGSEEMQRGLLSLKNMQTGEQRKLLVEQVLAELQA
ncbi:histidine--tRNA ligase [Mucilaginibacter arboris]|uniref:Histidine--tRNA ligase n=1 Tax=Mucilaginibacter arboris TaxID=2682090 RepID=A0A7K1SSD2_9SPHI|nr:histidine--tRNA ligase [Mucilaginibacter arboris]MVN20154.1 histidine--tRNA ligase [Mucilaginibacter arboris]